MVCLHGNQVKLFPYDYYFVSLHGVRLAEKSTWRHWLQSFVMEKTRTIERTVFLCSEYITTCIIHKGLKHQKLKILFDEKTSNLSVCVCVPSCLGACQV